MDTRSRSCYLKNGKNLQTVQVFASLSLRGIQKSHHAPIRSGTDAVIPI